MAPLDFKVGDQAFVKAKFFRTTRLSKKLSEKYFGPYKIITQAGPLSWTLRLPDSMRAVHPVFHISMLESVVSDLIPNRHQTPPPPVIVDSECYDFPFLLLLRYISFHSDRIPLLISTRLSSFSLSSFLFLDMTCYDSSSPRGYASPLFPHFL